MTNTAIEHPSWCDPVACETTDAKYKRHVSAALRLDTDPEKAISVAIKITQSHPDPAGPLDNAPLVEFAYRYPHWDPEAEDKEYFIPFTGQQAHTLGRLLTTAGREARA